MGHKMAAYVLDWSLTLFRTLNRFGTVVATALADGKCFTTGMSQQAEMVPLRHCHHGNIYLMCSDHFFGVQSRVRM